jgi:hypothetical protein
MKIKFEKGSTPEVITDTFLKFLRENDLMIGTTSIYFQTFDDEMKPEKWHFDDGESFVFKPSEQTKAEYNKQLLEHRRKMIKIVKPVVADEKENSDEVSI